MKHIFPAFESFINLGVFVAFCYGCCSILMAFANKMLLSMFLYDYEFFIMAAQMVFTVVVLETLRLTGKAQIPRYNLQRGLKFLLPACVYSFYSVLALSALSGMNIPMYSVMKRCGALVTLVLGVGILGKGWPKYNIIAAVGLITVGAVFAGVGDLSFDLRVYSYGGMSVVSQAVYLLLVQRLSSDYTTTETLHLTSINSLPLMCACCYFTGEYRRAFLNFDSGSPGFVFVFGIVVSIGCLLNYLLFLCTAMNSALTTSITGVLKSVLQTAIGLFTFGGISVNFFTVLGIVTNISGAVWYSYAKYREKIRRQSLPVVVETKDEKVIANGSV